MRLIPALALSAVTGYIALSYEILWYRAYSFVSRGRASSFGLLLGAYLLGIACGSFAARGWCRGAGDGDRRRLVVAIAGFVALANVAAFAVIPAVSWWVTRRPYGWTFPGVALVTSLLGGAFPLISHWGVAPGPRAGAQFSYLYVANIAGSAAGSLVTGFVLLDRMSLGGVSVVLVVIGLSMAACLLPGGGLSRRARRAAAAALAGAAALAVAGSPLLFGGLYERLQLTIDYTPDQRLVQVIENRSGVITVDAKGGVYGGGVYDGMFYTDLKRGGYMIVRPYALGALHPAPRRVMLIGLGSGSWAKVLLHHPDVEQLSILEINPGYRDLVAGRAEVSEIVRDPRVELIIDDGRRWLARHADRRFDAIVANVSFHWRAHATHVLSAEFLRLVRARLAEGGVYMYNTTGSERVQRTAALVFPHALRFTNCMVVSDAPLRIDKERWRRVLAGYRMDGRPVFDLSQEGDRRQLEEVLAIADTLDGGRPTDVMRFESKESLLTRTEGLAPVTDDNMGTEWEWGW